MCAGVFHHLACLTESRFVSTVSNTDSETVKSFVSVCSKLAKNEGIRSFNMIIATPSPIAERIFIIEP
jgi:hypothetical protein